MPFQLPFGSLATDPRYHANVSSRPTGKAALLAVMALLALGIVAALVLWTFGQPPPSAIPAPRAPRNRPTRASRRLGLDSREGIRA